MNYYKWTCIFHDDLLALYSIFQSSSLPVKSISFDTFKEYIYNQSRKYTI